MGGDPWIGPQGEGLLQGFEGVGQLAAAVLAQPVPSMMKGSLGARASPSADQRLGFVEAQVAIHQRVAEAL